MDSWTLWRGRSDTRRRTWSLWLLASALIHLPMTPAAALLGLLGWALTRPSADDIPALPPITEIPVEILESDPADAQPVGGPKSTEPGPGATGEGVAVPTPKPVPKPKPKPKPKPAERDRAEDAQAGAGGAGNATPPGKHAPAAGGSTGGEKKPEGIADPIAAAGGARKVADPNANVRVLVDTEKLRSHPMGPRIGALLSGIYQWRDFFGPSGINPVNDIDRILIAGPQLRRSDEVVAVLQHRVGQERIRAALDRLVQRDASGAWLDSKVPVAKARADRADRYFVLPNPRIVVVSPESTLESAKRLGAQVRLPALPGATVVNAYVNAPARAFRGLPFRVPDTLQWVRARIDATADNGAVVEIEAEDASEDAATQDAVFLTRNVTAATQLDLGLLGQLLGTRPQRFVERVEFEAKGRRVVGKIVLTAAQIAALYDFAQMFLVPPAPRTPAPAARGPAAPGDASPSVPNPSTSSPRDAAP
ncbi:MAG TPA: hypothetical protein VFQ61_24425 [Polyangiaceae bacterium]|nr:hypothetical protein [Polyangiaceae bacterium]